VKGKRRKRERDLKLNIKSFTNSTNNANNINNKRNNAKYKKTNIKFPRIGCRRCWHPASSCQAAPGSPGLASAVDRNDVGN